MSNKTTKLHSVNLLDLDSIESSDNVIHLPIRKKDIIASLEFAFEATGNIQYLNDIIRIEEKLAC